MVTHLLDHSMRSICCVTTTSWRYYRSMNAIPLVLHTYMTRALYSVVRASPHEVSNGFGKISAFHNVIS